MPAIQMTLFDESEIGLAHESQIKSTLSEWSYSRREMLAQCPRRYYYQYYGANQRTAKAEPQKAKLKFLKGLSNRYLRTGNILHLVISTYLNKLRQGEQWSPDRLLNWARKIYHDDLEYSRQYEHGTPLPDGNRGPFLLLEFYYGLENTEALCTESEGRLIAALTNFVKSPNLAQFRAGASHTSARIEASTSLKEAHFTLRGKVDLAYRDGDRVVIVDWKIGSAGSSDNSLQLLSYAWWARQKFECRPDRITLYRVHLADNTVSSSDVCEKDLMQVEARILQDLERMQEADDYGRRGIAEAFTPCAQPKVCALCPFQEVCPKE